ncbi:uncharacterized protein N7500_007918 [Penicillium coprophilum]|uniref:uncharacterized protein n=1 Tax=Penicillium coprophilum TaxID=36646 RepID=UPI002397CEFB|nr:uncharacterized protein N7500_007918 [Penicillium coprophilum]KAJ5158267.1 hypothetical protein N7500_007918 [Penicillium coprophilum]
MPAHNRILTRACSKLPILVLDSLRKGSMGITLDEKHQLLLEESQQILKKLKKLEELDVYFDASENAPAEVNMQRKLASIRSSVQEIQSFWLPDVLRACDLYHYSPKTSGKEDSFKIPLEFLAMLHEAAGLAYKDRDFQLGIELLDFSCHIFFHSRFDINGEERAKDEELATAEFLYTQIGIEMEDYDFAYEHIKKAMQQYLDQRSDFRVEVRYREREWMLRGCMAEALDGKGSHKEAERYYREALSLRPLHNKYSRYEVGLGRCLLLQGKSTEAKKQLASFLLELERAPGAVSRTRNHWIGLTLYWLGNAHDGDDGATAFEFYFRAFESLRLSLGEADPMFGAASYKLGEHHYTQAVTESSDVKFHADAALLYFRTALEVFHSGHSSEYRKADRARALYKIGCTYEVLRGLDEAKRAEYSQAADQALDKAFDLQKEIISTRNLDLNEIIHDQLVSRWSR